jgi:hypothetical protein
MAAHHPVVCGRRLSIILLLVVAYFGISTFSPAEADRRPGLIVRRGLVINEQPRERWDRRRRIA